jgi:transcriptional regulator GlxA family with amidase domain
LSASAQKIADDRIRSVLRLLHMQPRLRTNELAKHIGVSPSRLNSVFRRKAGMSIAEYSMALRLQRARELLLTTDLLIKEICFQAGIPNGPNFDREFKKHFKAPPSPVPGAISQSI